jgi:hypothetical protein
MYNIYADVYIALQHDLNVAQPADDAAGLVPEPAV